MKFFDDGRYIISQISLKFLVEVDSDRSNPGNSNNIQQFSAYHERDISPQLKNHSLYDSNENSNVLLPRKIQILYNLSQKITKKKSFPTIYVLYETLISRHVNFRCQSQLCIANSREITPKIFNYDNNNNNNQKKPDQGR